MIRLLAIAFWTAVRLHPRIRAYARKEMPIDSFPEDSHLLSGSTGVMNRGARRRASH